MTVQPIRFPSPDAAACWIRGKFRPWVSGGDYSLRRKLFIGTTIAAVCTAILAANIISRSYNDYRKARHNLGQIENYKLILDATNDLSAERGPTNSLLGDNNNGSRVLRDRLAAFRERSDASLDRLDPSKSGAGADVPQGIFKRVKEDLAGARKDLDRLTALPREQRSLAEVQAVIEKMFTVVDTFQPIVEWKAKKLIAENPELAGPVMTSWMFSDLREYGGRIGSQIIAPIAVSVPMPLKNLVDSNRTRGRLLQLLRMIGDQDVIGSRDPRLAVALHETKTIFFGQGLGILDQLVAEGRLSGNYGMTADDFTVRFVRTLAPLERVRRTFLEITIERLAAAQSSALSVLISTTIATAVILATLIGLMFIAQRFVFRPLMEAQDAVIGLAEDRFVTEFRGQHAGTEMRRLFEAIDVLRANLAERASLTRKLKRQAETDGLTGLMNRRALDMIGESHAGDLMMADGASLILMDIDHFKAINDLHGHLQGDQVLKETARLVQAMVGPNDIFARFGGEEFALLMAAHVSGSAISFAEEIRRVLEANRIVLSNGTTLNVTASFGVARGNLGQVGWRRLIELADTALYRAKSDGRNCVRIAEVPNPPLVPGWPDEVGSDVNDSVLP